MLGGLSQAQVYQTAEEEAVQEAAELMKQRYKEKIIEKERKEYENNAQNAVQPYKIEYPKTATKSKLPYDSYNPKYENSDDDRYYNKLKNSVNKQKFQSYSDQSVLASSSFQTFKNNYNDDLNDEYLTSHRQNRANNDMSESPSNHRPVYGPYRASKVKSNKASSKSGVKIENKSINKFKSLDTELRPPPIYLAY